MLTRRIRSMATARARRHNGGDRTIPTRRESEGGGGGGVVSGWSEGQLLSEDTTTTFFAIRLGRRGKGLAKEPLLTLSSLSQTSDRARLRPTASSFVEISPSNSSSPGSLLTVLPYALTSLRLCTTAVDITLLLPLTLLILCSVLMFLSILTSLSLLLTLLFAVIHYYHN